MRKNRWFQRNGWAKHVPVAFEEFRKHMIVGSDRGIYSITSIKNIMTAYDLSLTDATNLYVFLHGFPDGSVLYRKERFEAGEKVFLSITGRKEVITKLELVKPNV